MISVFDTLKERGFVSQCSGEEGLRKLLDTEQVTFYIGFDPTARSLHIGNLLQIMFMAHLQRAGHRPIALVGGGTTRIGDPSGKSEMRKILPVETIQENAEIFRRQISRFLDFGEGRALMLDNSEWLAPLNYIEFLRDIGRHFSVNRMLTFEAYKMRLETGLSFIEFNYQLLQAYDYLVLFRRHGCRLQMGGDDQWGNIVAGMDLIRRVEGAEVFALTSPLVTRSDGKKMGKVREGRHLPRPRPRQPLRVLPVLGERARRRPGAVPPALHVPAPGGGPVAVRREGRCDQRGQAQAGLRNHLARAWGRGGEGGCRRLARSLFRGRPRRPLGGSLHRHGPRRAGEGPRRPGPVRPNRAVRHEERRPQAGHAGRRVGRPKEHHGHRGSDPRTTASRTAPCCCARARKGTSGSS